MFDSPDEAMAYAEEVPGPFVRALEDRCERLGIHCVSGMLERDGDVLRNTAVLVGPEGLVGRYRKSHLPFLGVDRFVQAGDELSVFDTELGRIGLEICYDLRFPEVTRALALAGAELVALPTNWPVEAAANAELLTTARAYENRIFLLVANRVGRERSAEFCGRSQIVDQAGVRLAETDASERVPARRRDRRRASSRQVDRAGAGHLRDGTCSTTGGRSSTARWRRSESRSTPDERGVTDG